MPIQTALSRVEADDRPDAAGRELRTAGSYILVVDDEAVVRAFLARCLETEGYAVKQADGAAEALELMMSGPAAVVLCDIRMPGRDGLWLAERVHTHWPQVPIVMATAIDDFQTMRTSRDLGAVDYIAKPIAPGELLEVVRRVTAPQGLTEAAADEPAPPDEAPRPDDKIEAEYALETPVRCPACGERVQTLKAVRLIRTRVNFTSTLPRRGRVVACPHCLAIVPADLTNF
jgi:CheY-like chemotaxis protein/DNA-directed RNA polymerase subunit RPC12/RpoP